MTPGPDAARPPDDAGTAVPAPRDVVDPPSLLHVDLDAFFASVEQFLDPALRGRPVVVGGTGGRGVVAAASYEARHYGIHSALPTARARRLCPDAVFLPPRLGVYREFSQRVFAVFHDFTPLVEGLSLDEAFLDVSGARQLFGTGPEIAQAIRRRVRDEIGLVCSVGVATTKLLAKLASAAAKPDGMLVIEAGRELEFLHPLPVSRLWGVGPATARRLDRLGVRTVGDLAAVPEATLVSSLGEVHGRHLHALAWGRDDRPVDTSRPTKSVSSEETFARDLTDPDALRREVRRLAERVAARLRESGWWARTVTLKVRYADFRTVTRSATRPEATGLAADIAGSAVELLERLLDVAGRVGTGDGVRLLGVGVSNLEAASHHQEALPFDGSGPRAAVEAAVDAVRRRYGPDALGPGSLVEGGRLRTGRDTEHSWGPDQPR